MIPAQRPERGIGASAVPSPSRDGDAAGLGRALFRRWGALLLAGVAGLAAWALLGGPVMGRGRARGYAETIPLLAAPLRAGRIASVKVALGSQVKSGDELARLETLDLDAQRVRLDAERDVVRAKLAAAGGIENAAVLRSELWQLRTVAGARHDRAELAALEREVARLEGLYKDQLVRASDIEPLRRQREALAARVNTFALAARTGKAGLGRPTSGTGDDGAHASAVKERLEPLREQLRVADAAVAELDVHRAAAVLRAPADGVVASVDRRPGEAVAAGAPVVTISTGRPGVVIAFVPERQAVKVKIGDQVVVTSPAPFAHPQRGRVIEAAPEVAELPLRFRTTPTMPVWGRRVVVETPGATWLPGEELRVRF